MSVDPLSEDYEWQSIYSFSSNQPIHAPELEGLESADDKSLFNRFKEIVNEVASYTDLNDIAVGVTTVTREGLGWYPEKGNTAINIDGTTATSTDKAFAVAGAILPVVSGSAIKKIGGYLTGSHKSLTNAKLKDSHHIIQDAAVKNLPNYNRKEAPAIQLEGPSTKIGTPHYKATQAQRKSGGGTYASERRIGYRALREAGVPKETSKKVIRNADEYFKGIGVNLETKTRIPGNRK